MKQIARIVMLVACAGAPLLAQDTTRGVHIGLTYDPGARPTVIVLPVTGPRGDSIRAIIQRDLDYGDRVVVQTAPDSVLSAIAKASDSTGASTGLDYTVFHSLGALYVVQASMTPRGLHVALHDVAKAQVKNVNEFSLSPDLASRPWRLGVHGVSDQIEQWMTQVRGIASTRIAFTRDHAVHIVDSDGADDITIPMAGEGISPAWSPDAQRIAYATYGVDSRIVVYDLHAAQSRTFGKQRNTNNSAPTFSPDGSTIVYVLTGENGSDLFSMPATADGTPHRLSSGKGTDNSMPSFSPDGRHIAFVSGRAGAPEIYIMDADGTNPDLFTTYDFSTKNYRSNPSWSPDGLQIAYQSRVPEGAPGADFQLFTMSLRDRTPRQLTSDGRNEHASWAPDGRHLIFQSTRGGSSQLWVLDVESARLHQLTHGDPSLGPAWSSRLTSSPNAP